MMNRKPELFDQALEHHRAGRLREADRLYREILAQDDRHADALHMWGVLAQQTGRSDIAVELMERSLAVRWTEPACHFNLGVALQEQRRPRDAIDAYEVAIRLRPDYAEAHHNLGGALAALGRIEEAADRYRKAIILQPAYIQAYANIGLALQTLRRFEQAAGAYAGAVRLRPGHAEALNQQIQCRQQICDWRGIGLLQRDLLGSSERFSPFGALTIDSTPAQQLAVARTWCEQRYAAIKPLPRSAGHRGGKIRLGYLSADYCNHAMAHPVAALIEHHDRQSFEIIGYSYGPDDGSPMRRRLMTAFDRFTDIRSLPAIEAAKLIQADGIDILIDLAGYTTSARTEILAFRPAPVQVNFLGYPATMGAGFIDYIIADPVCIPPGEDVHFSETVVRLADCYQPNDGGRDIALTPSREACGLPAQGMVFCCFNNGYKITAEVFAVWMRLLTQVPGSVFWLLEGNDAARKNLRREAASAGVAPERLVFAPRQPMAEHLARHRLADLFLDTLPYNAHTTASDALWAGLPVLTCSGETFAGRVAASLLTAVGLPELITSSLADYEALALALAMEPARLVALRDKLAAGRGAVPLFDSMRFARTIETAYRQMAAPAIR